MGEKIPLIGTKNLLIAHCSPTIALQFFHYQITVNDLASDLWMYIIIYYIVYWKICWNSIMHYKILIVLKLFIIEFMSLLASNSRGTPFFLDIPRILVSQQFYPKLLFILKIKVIKYLRSQPCRFLMGTDMYFNKGNQ